MNDFLAPTYYFDYLSKEVQSFISPFKDLDLKRADLVSQLYLQVRDGWRYTPYRLGLLQEHYSASTIMKQDKANCVEKSIIYIACLRALGIPARIRLVKVKNHIGIERFVEKYGSNEITPHGMAELFINDKWLKASPAFNKELCVKCNVEPLAFNGKEDSLFQSYDKDGNTFMQYLEDYGHFEDLPFDFIIENFFKHYPKLKPVKGQEEVIIS